MNDDSVKQKALAKLVGKVMGDRQLIWKLTDKVYELMQEDLKQQKEKIRN